jgi:hypothetical protein
MSSRNFLVIQNILTKAASDSILHVNNTGEKLPGYASTSMKKPLECYIGAAPEYKESHPVPGKRLKAQKFEAIKLSDKTGRSNLLKKPVNK